MANKVSGSEKLAPKKTIRPTGVISQSEVSQPEILVLLDWLDKLSQVANRTQNSYVEGRIEIGYKVIDTYFRSTPNK